MRAAGAILLAIVVTSFVCSKPIVGIEFEINELRQKKELEKRNELESVKREIRFNLARELENEYSYFRFAPKGYLSDYTIYIQIFNTSDVNPIASEIWFGMDLFDSNYMKPVALAKNNHIFKYAEAGAMNKGVLHGNAFVIAVAERFRLAIRSGNIMELILSWIPILESEGIISEKRCILPRSQKELNINENTEFWVDTKLSGESRLFAALVTGSVPKEDNPFDDNYADGTIARIVTENIKFLNWTWLPREPITADDTVESVRVKYYSPFGRINEAFRSRYPIPIGEANND